MELNSVISFCTNEVEDIFGGSHVVCYRVSNMDCRNVKKSFCEFEYDIRQFFFLDCYDENMKEQDYLKRQISQTTSSIVPNPYWTPCRVQLSKISTTLVRHFVAKAIFCIPFSVVYNCSVMSNKPWSLVIIRT